MKIYRSAYAIIAASLLAITTGCSKTENVLGSQPDPLAVKVSPESVVFDWQEEYQNKLEQFQVSAACSTSSMFDIYDVTNDGVPELIISPSDDVSAMCEVYSLIGNELTKIAICGSFGEFVYFPSILVIGYEYSGEEFTIGEYQTYIDGFYGVDFDYFTNMNSASSGAVIRYEINGEGVSLDEFEERINAYQNEDSFKVGRKYTFSDDSIQYAVHCSESWSEVLTDAQKKKFKGKLSDVLASTSSADSAFELVDLDGNGLPEVIVSSGSLEEMPVNVYYLSGDGVKEIAATGDENGYLHFDIKNNVFYAPDHEGNLRSWSLSSESTSSFKPSDSLIVCGRKYLFTSDNIKLVFA